jgi:hypothetical protein
MRATAHSHRAQRFVGIIPPVEKFSAKTPLVAESVLSLTKNSLKLLMCKAIIELSIATIIDSTLINFL